MARAASLVLRTSRKELQVESPRALLVLKYRDQILAAAGREENADKLAKFAVDYVIDKAWARGF